MHDHLSEADRELLALEAALVREEAVTETVEAVEAAFPTGWTEFDVAWLHVRRDRPHTPPVGCPTVRLMVGKNLARLRPMVGLGPVDEAR